MSLSMFFRNKAIKSPLTINVKQQAFATTNVKYVNVVDSTPYSPLTPATPVSAANCPQSAFKVKSSMFPDSVDPQMNAQDLLKSTLKKYGYTPSKECVKTLQGSILEVTKDNKPFIIKATEKELHRKSITFVDGNAIRIHEDILKESSILKYLTSQKAPASLIKCMDQFSDDFHYYLVMEFGGDSLFSFVKESHAYIATKMIDIHAWHKCCKYAMNQMVSVLEWLHNEMSCCHLDVSLENFTVKHAQNIVIVKQCANKIALSHAFQVKLIDFGLAELFRTKGDNGKIDFNCNKYAGKTVYKAPRVYAKKKVFDARCADCWSLGVCFFMMFFGHPPWQKPIETDQLYRLLRDGYILDVLSSWDLLDYATAEILDLLMGIFRSQKYRLTIKQMKQHYFLASPQ